MAKSAEASMNVSALKSADPFVKEIIDTAAHVALYNFNSEAQEWEKTNIEGALFIYSRSSEPKYNAFVLNRLNTVNLIEPVDDGLEIQLQDPFLLYRNSTGSINGIWFYDREECVRIARTVERLVMEAKKSKEILGKNSPNLLNNANPRVMDFFAKATSKAPSKSTKPPLGFTKIEPEINPLLQRLMSTNPVQTVQDIEKKHNLLMKKCKKDETVPQSLYLNSQSIENGLGCLRLTESPPKQYSSSLQSQFFNPPLIQLPRQSPSVSDLPEVEKVEAPTLLPPGMFATKEEPVQLRLEPLTKTQLLQAVSYLLKNDADFVKKLHEAYVKSFVDMVS